MVLPPVSIVLTSAWAAESWTWNEVVYLQSKMGKVQSATAGTFRSHPEHQHDTVSCNWAINSRSWSFWGTATALARRVWPLWGFPKQHSALSTFYWELKISLPRGCDESHQHRGTITWAVRLLPCSFIRIPEMAMNMASLPRAQLCWGFPSAPSISLFICKSLLQVPNNQRHLLSSSLSNDASAHTD